MNIFLPVVMKTIIEKIMYYTEYTCTNGGIGSNSEEGFSK